MYKNTGATHDTPILWGTYNSFFTGKTRSYLIKKGVAHREMFRFHPRFKEVIVPLIGHFAIPVTELTDGTLIQDTTDTILHFEHEIKEPALIPSSPLQCTVAWILGCFGSESMWKLGLHYRWTYLEQQRPFIEAEFGRSNSSGTNAKARLEDAAPVMAWLRGKLPRLGVTETTIPSIEASYEELLDLLNQHFFHYPYLMGGRPSLPDFGLIAPFFAHFSRDPYPSNHMKLRAPNVFRWTERMFQNGFSDGEFPDMAPDFLLDDSLPETLIPILDYFFRDFSAEFIAMIESYNRWCNAQPKILSGKRIQDPEEPGTAHPSLDWIEFECRNVRHRRRDSVDVVYHLQRVFDVVDSLKGRDRDAYQTLIVRTHGQALMGSRLAHRIAYDHYDYVLA
jgi:glutathione S-transferase